MISNSILEIEILKAVEKREQINKYFKLIYVVKGEVNVKIGIEQYKLKEKDLIVINENESHSLKIEEDSIIISYIISNFEIRKIIAGDLLPFECNSIKYNNKDYSTLKDKIIKVLDSYLNNGSKIKLLSLKLDLINELIEKYSMKNDDEIVSYNKSKHLDRLNQIITYIDINYREPITLNNIAEKEFLSVPYLSKFIKNQLGVNFTEYLNSVRLNYAKDDLVNSDLPITKVALDNGFASTFIFNKYFKNIYKITPSEFRKKYKKDNYNKVSEINNADKEVKLYINEKELDSNIIYEKSNIDFNKSEVIKKNYNKIINIGYANDILQSVLQQHIIMLRQEIKFEYARLWGVFNEDMDIQSDGLKFNFYKIDKVLDFIVGNGMKPFIDLMPKAKKISKSPEENVSYEIEVIKYRSLEQWQQLMHQFIVHCINRYGKENVEKWYFEISRNENIKEILNYNSEDLAYFDMFNIIYKKIKEVLPFVKVGGPGGNFIKTNAAEFFLQWKKSKYKPDFISIFIYPYAVTKQDGKEDVHASVQNDYLTKKIESIKNDIINSGYEVEEIIITEWNSTISNRNYTNDSCFKSAYIVKNVIDSIGKVDMLGYCMVSDVFGEYKDTDLFLQGGSGLINNNGIKKPSYYSFLFLDKLSENIIKKGSDFILTKNGEDFYTLLCYNYKALNSEYLLYLEKSTAINEGGSIYEDEKNLKLEVSLSNIKNRMYRIKKYTLNKNHGSILNEWIKLNCENHLNSDEINYLKAISSPKLEIEYIEVINNSIHMTLELIPQEVKLVTFEVDYK